MLKQILPKMQTNKLQLHAEDVLLTETKWSNYKMHLLGCTAFVRMRSDDLRWLILNAKVKTRKDDFLHWIHRVLDSHRSIMVPDDSSHNCYEKGSKMSSLSLNHTSYLCHSTMHALKLWKYNVTEKPKGWLWGFIP